VAIAATRDPAPAEVVTTVAELVVTAEKREEKLQRTAVAITAFTGRRRDTIGIGTLEEMTNFTPGLEYDVAHDRASIRGVGRLTNQLSADASVANYSDGVYVTFAVTANMSSLFLDRVEILRGPQDTLYGRNAIAGAINQVSRRPTASPYAEVRLGYANYDHSDIEAAVSGPLSSRVGFRVAGQWEKQSQGWIHNVVPGMPSEGNVIDQGYLEGQIAVRFNERFDMWTKVAASWDHGAADAGSGWNPSPFSMDEGQFNTGYGCAGVATNVVNLNPLGCANVAATTPWLEATVEKRDVHVTSVGFASHWTWQGDSLEARYIVGGDYYHYTLTGTLDEAPITQYTLPGAFGLPGLVVHPRSDFNYQELNGFISHELNLLSTGDAPLQWLLGAYYFNQHYRQPVYSRFPDEPALDEVGGPEVFPGECGATGGVCAPVVDRRYYDSRPEGDALSLALFGQAQWAINDTLKLTAGLRYSNDRKHGVERVRLICYGLPDCFFFPEYASAFGGLPAIDLTQNQSVVGTPNNLPPPKGVTSPITYDPVTGMASRSYDASWGAFSGGAGLEWTPDRETLVYGKYDRGYRSGGFLVGINTALLQNPWSDKETVDAFEVGLKRTFGRRLVLDLALFHYGYRGLQIQATLPNTSGDLSQTQDFFFNIPRSVSQGLELETVWSPIDRLSVLFNYSFLDAHVEEGALVDPSDPSALQPGATPIGSIANCTNQIYGDATSTCVADLGTTPRPRVLCAFPAFQAPCMTTINGVAGGGYERVQDLKGDRLPNAPRNKIAINVTYAFPYANGLLTPSISYIWRDAQYGSLFTRPYNRAPPWDQWDARLSWTSQNGRLTLIAYGKNLAGTVGYDAGATSFRRGGRFDLPPYGFPYQSSIIRVDGISTVYTVTPPRTFGAELQYRFF
jgi:iron complex outermembrane receptor protein